MTSFLEKYLANPMRSLNVKLAILGFFAVLGAVGLYGSIKVCAPQTKLVPLYPGAVGLITVLTNCTTIRRVF